MKVLFIGEGRQDVGRAAYAQSPSLATGVIPILAKKVIPSIDDDSLMFQRDPLLRLDPKRPQKGLKFQVEAAAAIAKRYGCGATVFVQDQDRNGEARGELEEGKRLASEDSPQHRVVTGLAVESIEAWVLGSRTGLKAVLAVGDEQLDAVYRVSRVEGYHERSGKSEHQPKVLLRQAAELGHELDSADFRQRVAEATDIRELERNCPKGFAPFAKELRETFGTSATGALS